MEGLEAAVIPFSQLERTARFDSEYFQHRFIKSSALVQKLKCSHVASLAAVSDGNHFTISEDFVEEGIPYYRGQDVVGTFFIEMASPNFITEEAFERPYMKRSHLKKGDVLLSIVGTIGELSLVGSDAAATCSCKLAILRPHSINAEMLAVFLQSEHGRNQVERLTRGAIQKSLLLEDMDQLWVPAFSDNFSKLISKRVGNSRLQLERMYAEQGEAERLLIRSLGLADWKPPEPLSYVASSADAFAASRLDAQYFMPAKRIVRDALGAMPGQTLGERFYSIRDMFDPKSGTAPALVRNYDVTDALQPILDDEKEPVGTEEIGSLKKVFKDGDVAISRLRAYLREIAVVRTSGALPSVGSSEFIVLRPRNSQENRIAPETLLTFLRSAPVQTVLKWCRDGSQHPRFSEGDLLTIHVPDAVADVSPQIEAIVKQGFEARRRARELLDRAKRAVEIAIEDNEAAALRFLEEERA